MHYAGGSSEVSWQPPHLTEQYARNATMSLPRASASSGCDRRTTFSAGVSASSRLTSFPLGHLFTEAIPHTLPVSNNRHNERGCKQSFVHDGYKAVTQIRRNSPPERDVAPGRSSTSGGIRPSLPEISISLASAPRTKARQRFSVQGLRVSPVVGPRDHLPCREVHDDQRSHFFASSAAVSGLGVTLL